MLITTKRRYVKKHVIGGAGIFDTIVNLFKQVTGSTAAKAIQTPWKNAGLFCEICGPRSKIMRPKLVKYAVFSHAFDTILGLVHIIKKTEFNLYLMK
jgi:hypothetical protein